MKKVLSLTLALVMLFTLISCGGDNSTSAPAEVDSPETLAKSYVTAIFANDGEAVFNLTVDKYEIASKIESGYYENEEEYLADCKEEISEKLADYKEEYGTDVKISNIEIADAYSYSPEDEALLIKYLEETFYPEGSIEDIQTIQVNFKVKGSKGETTMGYQQSIAKVDGKWYWGITNLNATHSDVRSFIEELRAE